MRRKQTFWLIDSSIQGRKEKRMATTTTQQNLSLSNTLNPYLYLVTACDPKTNQMHGMIISWVTPISLVPKQDEYIVVGLSKTNMTSECILHSTYFALHLLPSSLQGSQLVEHFGLKSGASTAKCDVEHQKILGFCVQTTTVEDHGVSVNVPTIALTNTENEWMTTTTLPFGIFKVTSVQVQEDCHVAVCICQSLISCFITGNEPNDHDHEKGLHLRKHEAYQFSPVLKEQHLQQRDQHATMICTKSAGIGK